MGSREVSPLLCHRLFPAEATPRWKPGCQGPGCWEPLKGFGSCFHEPGGNSHRVKLTTKLTLVWSVAALGHLLMLQQYFCVILYCGVPELRLGAGCAVPAAPAPFWCVGSRPGLLAGLAAPFLQITQLGCSRHPSPLCVCLKETSSFWI